MSGIVTPALYLLSGVCIHAAWHHGLFAWRRPPERTHLLFALLCLLVGLYVLGQAAAYRADSVESLVLVRRWVLSLGIGAMAVLPWFVAEYTGVSTARLQLGLSACFAVVLVANLVLPYGISYPDAPRLEYLTLPWGERVTDLRVHQAGAWHNAMWAAIMVAFGLSFRACLLQYRRGGGRRAGVLAAGLTMFFAGALGNRLVNAGWVQWPHTAEFGFMALVLVMSQGLVREGRDQRRRMQALLDHVPAVVYIKDLQGRYLMANRAFHALLPPNLVPILGRTDHELFPAAQAEALRARDRRVVEDRRPREIAEVVDVQGRAREFTSLKFPLLDADGVPYALGGVSTDVTDLRRTESELQALRQRIWHTDRVERTDMLAASLAHELSQPLTAILSNAQAALLFLSRDDPDLTEIRDILQDIARDDQRAAAVIHNLRAMLRRQDGLRERIDLGQAVADLLDLMHSECLDRGVGLDRALAAGCTVLADKGQIQQVVLNLVMNAMEAMASQPAAERHLRVSLSCRPEGPARVAVCDRGVGIPPGQRDKVFEGFYTTKGQGLGMGLAVCRSIVEAHGGAIGVEPNEGPGVTFFFTLPYGDAPAAP